MWDSGIFAFISVFLVNVGMFYFKIGNVNMIRHCIDCKKDISDRGNRSQRCIECQTKHRYMKKNIVRRKKYSERKIIGEHFFMDEDDRIRHISSTQTREDDFVDGECVMCEIEEMPGMVTLRKGQIKEIFRSEIPYVRKAKDWEELKRLYNEVNQLRREIKIIIDWYKHRRESEPEYWEMKTKEWKERFEREDYESTEEKY